MKYSSKTGYVEQMKKKINTKFLLKILTESVAKIIIHINSMILSRISKTKYGYYATLPF